MKATAPKKTKTPKEVEKKTNAKVSKTWLAMMTLKGGEIIDMRAVLK